VRYSSTAGYTIHSRCSWSWSHWSWIQLDVYGYSIQHIAYSYQSYQLAAAADSWIQWDTARYSGSGSAAAATMAKYINI